MASLRASVTWLLSVLAAAIIPTAIAQTWTDCNPMFQDGCPPHPALSGSYTCDFNGPLDDAMWRTTAGKVEMADDGGEFTIAAPLQSATIQSQFYIFFGRLEVIMKAATGRGIVSSIVLQSETLDEIDWEWVGVFPSHVQTNYFGKGNTTTYDRSGNHDVNAAMDQFHNYTINWSKDQLQWWLDGSLVRTVHYQDALGGKNYPQTPATVRLGIWPAGDPGNAPGTIEWAGGEVDYDAGPYVMTVKQLTVEDFSSGKEYVYGDRSGSWESIQIVKETSAQPKDASPQPREESIPLKEPSPEPEVVHEPQRKSPSRRWEDLPKTTRVGISTSTGIIAGLIVSVLGFCFIKRRRAGRKEYSVENSKFLDGQNSSESVRA